MKHFIPIVLLIFIVGCGDSNNSKSLENIDSLPFKTSTKIIDSTLTKPKQKETLNFTDSKGLKQGKWVKKWKGKIVYVEHYKDNLLHGYYAYYLAGNEIACDGNYINGKREGMFFSYYDFKSKSIEMESFYKNDTSIWGGFPAAMEDRLVPVKGFWINKDTVFIQAPDYYGKIWYEGNFCLRFSKMNKQKLTYAYGIHKVYFKNGKLKGIVDYDKQTIQEFDKNGIKLYKAKFNEFDIHKQSVSWSK